MTRSISGDDPPLHLAISEQLREQIVRGQYSSGNQLPSEHQLMERFSVSRITVRRAIANLVNQGLVESRQGKGVFVKLQRKVVYPLANPLTFFDEAMAQQGVSLAIRNLVYDPMKPPVEVRQTLKLSPSTRRVYFQKKLILINEVPIAVDRTYILSKFGKPLATALQRQMTFPTLEANGVMISRIEALLEATHANYELSEHLGVPLGDPLIIYRYTAYSQPDQPVLCGESLCRGDRLCYSVVLAREARSSAIAPPSPPRPPGLDIH